MAKTHQDLNSIPGLETERSPASKKQAQKVAKGAGKFIGGALLKTAAGLAIPIIAAVGFKLSSSESKPATHTKPAGITPTSEVVPTSQTPDVIPTSKDISFQAEGFIQDNFYKQLRSKPVSHLDGVSLVLKNYDGVVENPAIVVVREMSTEDIGVVFDFEGQPLAPNEQLAFVAPTPEGAVEIFQLDNIEAAYTTGASRLDIEQATLRDNSVFFETVNGQLAQSLSLSFYDTADPQAAVEEELTRVDATTPITLADLVEITDGPA